MGAVQARPRPGPLPAVRATPRPSRALCAPAAAARRRLLVMAPAWGAQVVAALDGPGVVTELRERGAAASAGTDPYGIASSLDGARPDAVLLVAPRGRAPARLVPGPVVDGVPVAVVQADGPAELAPWLAAVRQAGLPDPAPAWAVLAMAKEQYLGLARRFHDTLQAGAAGRVAVPDWMADRLTADEAAAALAGGPRLAVYLGHGRSNGWSGYQAFRWTHVAAAPLVRACGTVIGFSCRNLQHVRGALPFGTRWVMEGRAAAFLGAVSDVTTEGGFTLADELARELAEGGHASIGAVLAALDRRLASDPALALAYRELRRFRLMGHPLQPLL